jgi:hypothetical protein
MKYTKIETQKATEFLNNNIKVGDTLYTIETHVTKSGMSRSIRVFDKNKDDITFYVARILGETIDQNNGGIKVSGCGMDMGFEIVYRLGYALYPKGFKVNGIGRNGDTSGYDNDGGYALKQRWL